MGHIIYTVYETQWMPQLGDGPAARVPQHRFFLVRIIAVNSGSADLIVPNATIEDDKGNSYPELQNGDGVPRWIGYLRTVKPAESAQGNLVFDAPPAHYRLRITDEGEDHSAYIDIPLSFGAELPPRPPNCPRRAARRSDSARSPAALPVFSTRVPGAVSGSIHRAAGA